jgi:predicted nucleic acid-binding protein
VSYLIDTTVLSEWRKSSPNPGLEDWWSRVHMDDLFISVITIGEIAQATIMLQRRNDHRQAMLIESWLANIRNTFGERLVPVDLRVAEQWARNRVQTPNALIAATAQVHGWAVVTRNAKAFEPTGVRVLNPFTE